VLAALIQACASASPTAPERAREVLRERPVEKKGLVLACEPADAEVEVDEIPRGTCADFGRQRPVSLGEGMHRVDVRKDGFEPYRTFVEPGGAQAIVEMRLTPLTKP
jgi:hypothetical protein